MAIKQLKDYIKPTHIVDENFVLPRVCKLLMRIIPWQALSLRKELKTSASIPANFNAQRRLTLMFEIAKHEKQIEGETKVLGIVRGGCGISRSHNN